MGFLIPFLPSFVEIVIVVAVGFLLYKTLAPKGAGSEKIARNIGMNDGQDEHGMFNAFIIFGVFFIVWALGFFLKRFTLHDGIKTAAIFLLAIIAFFIGEYFRSRE